MASATGGGSRGGADSGTGGSGAASATSLANGHSHDGPSAVPSGGGAADILAGAPVADAFPQLVALRETLLHEIEELRTTDAAAAAAALGMLQRAWLLGPRRVGPNVLMAPSSAGSGAGAAAGGGTLFDVPAAAVVKVSKQQHGSGPGQQQGSGLGGPGEDAAAGPQQQQAAQHAAAGSAQAAGQADGEAGSTSGQVKPRGANGPASFNAG